MTTETPAEKAWRRSPEAPYTDPDGFPSYQPGEAQRAKDARARRIREAREAWERAARLADDARRVLAHLDAETTRLGRQLDALIAVDVTE